MTSGSLYTTRRSYPAGRVRCKSLYDTDLAVKLDLHYAYTTVPGSREMMLAEGDALLHHYRQTRMSAMSDEDQPGKYEYARDDFMLRHEQRLTARVKMRLKEAGEFRPV